MGESSGASSSSRKRRRGRSDSHSRSRSRSRSRARKGSSSKGSSSRHHHRRGTSASRSRSRSPESRSRRKHREERSRRKHSDASASSRSPSRSSKDKEKARKRSRRSRSKSRKDRKHAKKSHDKDPHRHSSRRSVSASRSRSRSPTRHRGEGKPRESAPTPTLGDRHQHQHERQHQHQPQPLAPTTRAEPPHRQPDVPKSVLKPFTFTGISLKTTDKKTAAATKPKETVETNGTDEMQRRREKLKAWREQQQKQQQQQQAAQDADEKEQESKHQKSQLVRNFLAEEDAVPPRIQLWSLDEGEEETAEAKKKRSEEHEAQRQREQKVVEEVDPLDAYMAGLVDEAAIQQSIVNPMANVISLDEIQAQDKKLNIYGTFLPPQEQLEEEMTVPVAASVAPVQEKPVAPSNETEQEREAREERELKEFMRAIREKREQEEKAKAENGVSGVDASESTEASAKKDDTGRIYQGVDEDNIGEEADNVDHRSALEILQEAQKKKEIQPVDHSKVDYLPLQKKFYMVPHEIKDLSEDDVQAIRDELEIKVRGKNCPRPLDKWSQCGFSVRMLQLIQRQGYTEPFAIQRQALPAIMSGRDVIGIAKTGSGKTLAFLLPMFRHILAQPPLKDGEGPIGMIMAPARELAQQIYIEAKKFAKGLGMRATAVYGGSSVSEQIGNLKRGSDIVICTPGRMIDILCMSAGKMVSLKRVTYVVLDEADRMFDMGFEPQITKIMMNIRPDRQTLLFSATFPKAVETLARKVLKKPVEITVGARSTASGDIKQYVEVREEKDKFMRLLQLLGLWYEKGNVLVFVNTQQACDQLFQDLMKAGYPALSLHGGKDQVDRDFTIDDFKRKVRSLMVATSVAGRGLDVKDLVLVINYHCPNHLEDYVHRVGRTGRAGRKGTAYTFISPDEEEYSVDLVKALESAKQEVPPELTALADNFKERVRKGEARYHGSGFKGKGFTFDESEKNETQRVADMQRRQYELAEGIVIENQDDSDDDDDNDAFDQPSAVVPEATPAPQAAAATAAATAPVDNEALSAVRKAQRIAQILDRQYKQSQGVAVGDDESHFEEELEINDYPQQARWKVTQKEATERVAELTGVAVITRGSFVPAGRKPNPGERKLYLAIEGPSRSAVLEARRELQRILDETTLQVGLGGDRYGKYNL